MLRRTLARRSEDANHQRRQGLSRHHHRQRRLRRNGGVEPDAARASTSSCSMPGRSSIASKYWTHVRPWEARERQARGEAPPAFFLDTREQPYFTPPGRQFDLTRVWGHGGKTNVWGRVSLRLSDLDFKGAEADGWEIPWPIAYKDISPYYDQVEQLIGVCGGTDDSDSLPGSKFLQPPPAPRCGERLLQKAAGKVGIPIVAGRRANMTQATRGFPPCHYCGACGSGCDTASFFNSADHLLPFALETGHLEIRSNAVGSASTGGRQGAREGSAVLRPRDRRRAAGARQGRGPRREHRRFDADPAELDVRQVSERHRQRLGRDRPLSVRADPLSRSRHPARAGRHRDTQRSRHRRRARLHAALQPSPGPQARLPARIRRPVLEHRRQRRRRARRQRADSRIRRVAEEGDQAAPPGLVRDPSLWRGAAVRAQPHHRRHESQGPLRRAAAGDRLSHRRERAEDGRAHERHGRGDRQGGRRRARSATSAAISIATARRSTSTAPAAWAPIRSDRR